jgi:hypothetical protein
LWPCWVGWEVGHTVTRPQTDLKLYSVEAMSRNDPLRCSFF